jgi:hypothetical protein
VAAIELESRERAPIALGEAARRAFEATLA